MTNKVKSKTVKKKNLTFIEFEAMIKDLKSKNPNLVVQTPSFIRKWIRRGATGEVPKGKYTIEMHKAYPGPIGHILLCEKNIKVIVE